MRIDAITVALLDMPVSNGREFNRWYDFDHLPEHVSKGDVVAGARYAATSALRNHPALTVGEPLGAMPPYATIYSFGGPLDVHDPAAQAGWIAKDRQIVRSGRYWKEGGVGHSSTWRPEWMRLRRSLHVADDAVLHLPHRSLVLFYGVTNDAARSDDWWLTTQVDDLLDLDGMLALVQFRAASDPADPGRLHVMLAECDAASALDAVSRLRTSHVAVGRYPPHGEPYRIESLLAYDRIIALDYRFVDDM